MGLASTMPYLAVVLPLVAMHMLVGVASATSPAASTGGCPFARYGTAFASWTTVRPSTPPSLLRHSVASLDPTVDGGKKVREARSASNELFVVGLSHHNAKVEVREKLACPEAEWNALARQMTELDAVDEAAVLSTCNRFEVYFASADGPRAMFEVSRLLSERSNVPLSALRSNLIMLNGQDAVWHALRVSAGLDSLVVGEGQILSQVKQCYYHSMEHFDEADLEAVEEADREKLVDGSGGKVVTRMLNAAVAAGKRVRDETGISRGSVSVSSAAAELSEQSAEKDLGMAYGDATVAIVGAGKMTKLLVTHLASHGRTKFIILNRSLPRAEELALGYPDCDFDIRLMDRMEETLAEADVVYTASSATDFLVTPEILAREVPAGRGDRPLMVVDIAVPRNVDVAGCAALPNVAAYDVDDLKAVVAKNTAKRRRECLLAEDLLREEMEMFESWQSSLDAVPAINALQVEAEKMRQAVMKKECKKLKGLSDKEQETIERLSRGITNKLLHGPMSALRSGGASDETASTLTAVRKMFRLGEGGGRSGARK